MGRLKIGVTIESFKLGVKGGIKKASEVGADGFQINAASGEVSPENLSQSGRAHFLDFAASHGLQISALRGDHGRGFGDERTVEGMIEKTKRIVELAVDLRTPIVTTHIGAVAKDKDDPSRRIMVEALNDIGRYAARYECFLATETGLEEGAVLKDLIESLDTEGLKVNFDPANLVTMGLDPIKSAYDLRDHIVYTHAKDVVRTSSGPKDVPFGEGEVPFDKYIEVMDEVGYNGFYTIEREVGTDPVADIIKAKMFLERY